MFCSVIKSQGTFGLFFGPTHSHSPFFYAHHTSKWSPLTRIPLLNTILPFFFGKIVVRITSSILQRQNKFSVNLGNSKGRSSTIVVVPSLNPHLFVTPVNPPILDSSSLGLLHSSSDSHLSFCSLSKLSVILRS